MSERDVSPDIDTAKLIAQARRWDPDGELGKQFWALADALERAVKEARAAVPLINRQRERAEAAEAQRDALAKAILAALNELGVPGVGYPAPVAEAHALLVAALAGVAPPEEQPK